MIAIIVYGIISGLIIGLLALAFQINFRIYKMFDLSQAGIYVCTSYFFIKLSEFFLNSYSVVTTLMIIIITCCFGWGLSLLIYHLVYKKFIYKRTSSLTFMVISLAIYMIMVNITALLYGSETQIINIDGFSSKSIQIGAIIITYIQLFQLGVVSLTLLFILFILNKKNIGKEIIALSENQELFTTLGYNLTKTRTYALLISGILIAVASILKSLEFGVEPFNIGFQSILLGIVAVLIGGIHSFKGAILGGVFIGIINNLGAWFFSGEWQETIAFVVLLIVLIFKKDGFFSVNLRLEE